MIINPVETKNALKEAVATVGSKKSVGSGKQEVSEKIGKAKELLLSQRTVENDVFCGTVPKPEPGLCRPEPECGTVPKPEPKPYPEPWLKPRPGECGTVPKPEPKPYPEPWLKSQPGDCGTVPKSEPEPRPCYDE